MARTIPLTSGLVEQKKSESKWEATLRKCETDWKSLSTKNNFARHFHHRASDFKINLAEVLEMAARDDWPDVILAVGRMLTNRETNIDGCVRWSLLLSLADSDNSDGPGAFQDCNMELVKMLVDAEPFLAFENPYYQLDETGRWISGAHDIWKSECYSAAHWDNKKMSTPFHRAAANGNAKALKLMITSFQKYCETEKQKEMRGDTAYQRPIFSGRKDNPVVHALRYGDCPDANTALQLASKAGRGNLGALEVLLSVSQLAKHPDKTFEEALDSGADEIISMFLKIPELVKLYVTPVNIIRAMNKISKQKGEESYGIRGEGEPKKMVPNNPSIRVIHSLIQNAKTESVFNREVVEKIIALNLTRLWKDERPQQLEFKDCFSLHMAVMHQNLEFVKMFVEEYNETVTVQAEMHDTDKRSYYPLWFNNHRWDKGSGMWVERSGLPDIRTALVVATIRQKDKMQDLSEILHLSGEKVRELCFDISLFNSTSYRLHEFVRSLIAHRENETLLKYERTIKYARFPPMDLHPQDREVFGDPVRRDHKEVFDILKWLRDVKGVKSIIELKVPDRLVNPHNEETIAKVVKNFDVEVLDWRFLDLSLSVFADVRSQIRGLHLYASGKRAVISHWMSEQGLECFTNLAFLRIHIVQETMTKSASDKTCALVRQAVLALKRKLKPLRNFSLDFDVSSQPWNQNHNGLADLEDLAEKAFPTLSQFISKYQNLATKDPPPKRYRPTRIAIIDNGIMSISPAMHDDARDHGRLRLARRTGADKQPESLGRVQSSRLPPNTNGINRSTASENNSEDTGDEFSSDGSEDGTKDVGDSSQGELSNQKRRDNAGGQRTLWSRIKLGRSFVDDDHQLSPWLFASDPHGTQLANLICAIDPACELYVAKVTDSCDGITPHRVARAIEWATEAKVDIISMSFAMLDGKDVLAPAVKKAKEEGIIMLCSTHDEGSNVEKAFPASLIDTWTVAACNEYGTALRPVKTDDYQYMLQGLNVPAGVIPFLDSKDCISGSSVATAIAAGLCSLILSCLRLANPDETFEGSLNRPDNVEIKLDQLKQGESKYVILEKFGGIDNSRKLMIPITAEEVIKTFKVS